MQTRSKLSIWRIFVLLLLLTLICAPMAGPSVLAAPDSIPARQEPDPSAPAGQGEGAVQELSPEAPDGPTAPGDHLITNITLGPDTPNILRTNQNVDLTFSYSTTEPTGVRIFARPYTNGSPTPNYAAHPSPLYPTSATGSASGWFTISTGTVEVDQVRLQMYNANQSALLFDAYIPVYYLFSDVANIVTHIALTPDTPDVLKFDQNVDFRFNYTTRESDGVRIWLRPFTNGALTPNYAAHPSPVHPPSSGSSSGFFTISSGQVVVDQIRIQMWDANQTILLFEAFLPVYYRFRSPTNIVTHIELSPDTPNIFKYNQDVNLTFNYTTNQPGGVRIWARPFSGANLSPAYAAHGSIVHPTGSGSATGSFSLTAGPLVVDKVRIQMWDANQTVLLFEAFLPVSLFWAGAGPPPGPDMRVNAIEVTQAIQDLNNSVDLVAGKRTYVRVHASSPANIADVFATLTGKRGFITLNPILNPGNPGSDITVRTSPDRGQINDSFWFELPSSWTTDGNLTLTARLDPNNAKNDLNQANNIASVTVNFKNTPPLRLRLVNVQYSVGSTNYLAGNSHLNALESWLRRAYPISSLQVTRQTFVYPTSGLPNVDTLHGWLALAKLLRMLFSGEDGRVVYYGVVDDGGGFMRGKAAGIPGTIAAGPSGPGDWGWDFDGSYNDWYGGHEIGHTRGRSHAEFCGAGGGAAYPYTGGRISPDLTGNGAIYGFDITTRAIYPPSWKDVMTYCSNEWLSDFTYEGIRSYLMGLGFGPEPAAVTASEFLIVAGMADLESNTASLDNVYLISQDNTLPLPEPGDWEIALVGAADNVLASYPFAPDELTDAEESPGTPAVIAEVVPWAAGAVKVEIRYQGQVVASRSASANPPSVNLTSPADGAQLADGPFQVSWTGSDPDGDPLTYSLLYSNDGGQNWQTLATNLTTTGLELNTSQLPGGSGLLRVVASDGFLSGQDTSGAIGVPLHAPDAQILLPNPDQVFYPTQQVVLQGSAYDLEDGSLGDAAFAWSSSIDGDLGTGASLSTSELSTGSHVITMLVTDSHGMSTQVQRSITVTPEDTAEASNLVLAPFGVSANAELGGAPVQEGLTVRSSSETEVDWTASEDIPWLSLSTGSGQSPADLVLTMDPSGLHPGTYSGKITFSSPQAGNSPAEVVVTLHVSGRALYLPLISRPQ
jgi:hypothetical protein